MKEARERVEKGRGRLKRYRELAWEIEAQAKAVKEWSEKIKPHQPAEEKRPLWDADDAGQRGAAAEEQNTGPQFRRAAI